MKILIGPILLIAICQVARAQFYYKDLVVPRQNTAQWKLYKDNRVRMVRLKSMEGDGQVIAGFEGSQEVTGDFSRITTHTKIAATGNPDSWIISTYSAQGLPLSTEDTSDTYQSISTYQYDPAGRLQSITNTSTETDNHLKDVEQHLWQYDGQGKPIGLLKIKNNTDTTAVRFVMDEKGNIAEERARRKNTDLPIIYYYYDAGNRLTDIVRFNLRAQKLLPDNIFEYGDTDRPSSMLVVPDGSNDYQKWVYEYNEKGLKIKESCFNRRRQLLGVIEYQYSFK